MRRYYAADMYGYFEIVTIDDRKKEYYFDSTRADSVPNASPLDGRDYYELLKQLDEADYSCLIPF